MLPSRDDQSDADDKVLTRLAPLPNYELFPGWDDCDAGSSVLKGA